MKRYIVVLSVPVNHDFGEDPPELWDWTDMLGTIEPVVVVATLPAGPEQQ